MNTGRLGLERITPTPKRRNPVLRYRAQAVTYSYIGIPAPVRVTCTNGGTRGKIAMEDRDGLIRPLLRPIGGYAARRQEEQELIESWEER
jgi:hypothetical protein